MNTTSISLIERLREPGQEDAWSRLVELYTPLLFFWAHRAGLCDQDAADLVQDVFAVLVQKLPEFLYDQRKSFRGWLRTILTNKWRDRCRRQAASPIQASGPAALAGAASPDPVEAFWEDEYRKHLVGRALELMKSEFQTNTWQACWKLVVLDQSAKEVAAQLGMSVDSVYAAKSRVLRRLRQELEGFLE